MSFWSDFSGKSAQKDIKSANKKAIGHLDQGYADLKGEYGQAFDLFDPYAQSGAAGNAMYADAIGLNGVDKRQGIVDQYAGSADPFMKFNEDRALQAVNRGANASGQFGSGVAALAGARATQEVGSNAWNTLLDRWNGVSGQGMQAAGAQAGIKTGLGDSAWNVGATKAGQATNFGNSMAASRSTLTNNLLGVAGLGVNAMSAYNKTPSGRGTA